MSGKSRQLSIQPSKGTETAPALPPELATLKAELARAEFWAHIMDNHGQMDTAHHQTARRLRLALNLLEGDEHGNQGSS